MCTNPLHIINPKKYIYLNSGMPLYLNVPCGHCVECRLQRSNEWRLRSYYECLDYISQGYYILFDTLTYSDKNLPHCKEYIPELPDKLNFSCFSYNDIKLFLKRLRSNLSRLGYEVENKLRYFITCEYGSPKFTTRPHYHCFFFSPSYIPISVLSDVIDKSWSLGRTDGVNYRGYMYVKSHNTFEDMTVSTLKVVNYVSKYVCKDFEYDDICRSRLSSLMSEKFKNFDWEMDKEERDYYKKLLRFVRPFHVQSKSYGSFIYQCNNKENILKNGFIRFRNSDGTYKAYGLFPSLKRKLFYDHFRDNLGDVHFELNEFGLQYKLLHWKDTLRFVGQRLFNSNLSESDIFNYCFNYERLLDKPCDLNNIENIIKTTYFSDFNTIVLRNYAFYDKDLIKVPVFSLFEFGSKKHGFKKHNTFKFVKGIPIEKFDIIHIKDLEKYMIDCPLIRSSIDKFKLDEYIIGQNKMAVERLKSRISKNFKNY